MPLQPSTMLRRLVGRVSMPAQWYLRRRMRRLALASDTWSAEQIREYQNRKLVELVRLAGTRVPFYQQLYAEAGVDVRGFRGIEDLAELPLVTKAQVKEQGHLMTVPGVPAWRTSWSHTGGSTSGWVAKIYGYRGQTPLEAAHIDALWQRAGVSPGDRMAVLRGEITRADSGAWRFDAGQNRLLLSSYQLKPEVVREFIEVMKRYEVRWLHAYPSSAWALVTLLQRHGIRFDVPLRGLLLGSESVFEWQYEVFRRVLGCRLYTHYGHGERALLAGWCEHTTDYHFLPTYGYVEFRPVERFDLDAREGMAELVGTGFMNRYMPLIRYATQDYALPAEPGPCPGCGRNHVRAKVIYGRGQNFLIARDGTVVPHTNLGIHSYHLASRYQFVQDEPGKVVFRFVPADPSQGPAAVAQLEKDFLGLQDWGLSVRAEVAPDLPRTWTGKDIFVVRSIPLPWERGGGPATGAPA